MKVEKIDHLHMYVKNLESTTNALRDVLGSDFATFKNGSVYLDLTEQFGMRGSHHPLGLHLIEVTNPELRKGRLPKPGSPEGIFAISLKVPNTDEAVAELKSHGFKLISQAKVGQVIETLLDSPDIPVQIELSEYPGDDIVAAAGT